MQIHIVGGGLAGCEAAWQSLKHGNEVILYEMRPKISTPAHKTGDLAELVCSNTFKSTKAGSAPAILKHDMDCYGSLVLEQARLSTVPAGQALGVDRLQFAKALTATLTNQPNFKRVDQEVTTIPSTEDLATQNACWIIATGPLTSQNLIPAIENLSGKSSRLFFYDAIAPIIAADTIDLEHCFFGERYNEASDDYLNIPLDRPTYEQMISDILNADKTALHDFENTKYFESCLPIEVMAERGLDTLRFGPLKPVGFRDPRTERRPWALIQLRRENKLGTMYSMVGFQTKMKWPAQKEVFTRIPALRQAEFLRYGSVHRNTYLNSPTCLNKDLSFISNPRVFLAGQITGVEGYTESAAMGLVAGLAASCRLRGQNFVAPPTDTMIGALLNYVTRGGEGPFAPMNCNMGLLPGIPKQRGISKVERRMQQYTNALARFEEYFRSANASLQQS